MPAAPAAEALRPQQRSQDGNAKSKPDVDPATLTLEDLRPYFCEGTIQQASQKIGVGLTALKRRCRALGIRRWPFRQVRRRTSGRPAPHVSNAHTPRPQLSSTKKMIDVFRKWGEGQLDARQRFHQQVSAAREKAKRYDRRMCTSARPEPECDRNRMVLTNCWNSTTPCSSTRTSRWMRNR